MIKRNLKRFLVIILTIMLVIMNSGTAYGRDFNETPITPDENATLSAMVAEIKNKSSENDYNKDYFTTVISVLNEFWKNQYFDQSGKEIYSGDKEQYEKHEWGLNVLQNYLENNEEIKDFIEENKETENFWSPLDQIDKEIKGAEENNNIIDNRNENEDDILSGYKEDIEKIIKGEDTTQTIEQCS